MSISPGLEQRFQRFAFLKCNNALRVFTFILALNAAKIADYNKKCFK